ncbi:MAG: hypothetical protein LBV69_09880 [Bacteroidales bacterium]|jgi:hypothetical protein|nr:hypothetical protein [Bacteroidales bacterium]
MGNREDAIQGWNIQDYYIYDYIVNNGFIIVKQINLFLCKARVNDKKH